MNATKPYVMGKLLHILNDWDSYLTNYLQTDFIFNLIHDAAVNSRLKCGLQTIQDKDKLADLGTYLEITLVLIRHQLSSVINILNQFNSLSDYVALSKKEQDQKALQILKDFSTAIDLISFPELTTENKKLDSFF